MSDKVVYEFLDTNILVYAHDQSTGDKHQQAKDLVQKLWDSGTGCKGVRIFIPVTFLIPARPG